MSGVTGHPSKVSSASFSARSSRCGPREAGGVSSHASRSASIPSGYFGGRVGVVARGAGELVQGALARVQRRGAGRAVAPVRVGSGPRGARQGAEAPAGGPGPLRATERPLGGLPGPYGALDAGELVEPRRPVRPGPAGGAAVRVTRRSGGTSVSGGGGRRRRDGASPSSLDEPSARGVWRMGVR